MSSTNRGRDRNRSDWYPTPPWCVDALLGAISSRLPSGRWLEPCAGDGSIIRAVQRWRPELKWYAHELRREHGPELAQLDAVRGLVLGDFRHASHAQGYAVGLTNPPFKLAEVFARRMRQITDHTILLLRLNFLGGEARNAWLRATRPDLYVLPERPQTDSVEYAWFHWHAKSSGVYTVLPTTPVERRSRRAPAPANPLAGYTA